VAVWTVDDPTEAARFLGMGVGRVTTNQVDALLAWKTSLPAA
jgi:glycerophosphoryl diester phosphodiesterase